MTIGFRRSSLLALRALRARGHAEQRVSKLLQRARPRPRAPHTRGWDASRDSPDLNLWLVVALHNLRGKVLDAQGRLQRGLDAVQVWSQRQGHASSAAKPNTRGAAATLRRKNTRVSRARCEGVGHSEKERCVRGAPVLGPVHAEPRSQAMLASLGHLCAEARLFLPAPCSLFFLPGTAARTCWEAVARQPQRRTPTAAATHVVFLPFQVSRARWLLRLFRLAVQRRFFPPATCCIVQRFHRALVNLSRVGLWLRKLWSHAWLRMHSGRAHDWACCWQEACSMHTRQHAFSARRL